ncbi:branched-chain amino acid transport system II carrier protein [Cytobacillus sp. FJAT-53684]|uniref:Branched-chain amino acid transport system carrier protein n=1 Tax=Cytobacillus mangrovibacter TaxID=3299024 RepID=A0ABW6K296_9BACI
MNTNLSGKQITAVGLMLFALFFGAGNMIFPPFLGQDAGTNMWTAIIGFLITGVGLPLLGVIAISKVGDLQTLGNRVHPVFAVIFAVVLYLVIGPLFAIPRTGTVAFEIGVVPFLPEGTSTGIWLLVFTIIYFIISAWLSMNPSKLVDRIGKLLTPALLTVLGLFVVKALITPLGAPQAPVGPYADGAFFKGFVEGYLTMDAIASLVFGGMVIATIKGMGVTNTKSLSKLTIKAAVVAAAGLALVYLSLAYIGSTSPEAIGLHENGGSLLSAAASHLFGSFGSVILGLAILFACLTTAVGLISSCAQYFNKLMPNLSYKTLVIIFAAFSAVIANVGLTQLISFSVPVLVFIYPLAIVLILLSFVHNLFNGYALVYRFALIPTGLIGLVDGLNAAGVNVSAITEVLDVLPLFSQGLGWLVPAIVGAVVGYAIALVVGSAKNKTVPSNN